MPYESEHTRGMVMGSATEIEKSVSTKKIALAISGGGYRATLYALGTLWRLNELGIFPKLKTITSVSGGSILSAWLAHNWGRLIFDNDGVASNFIELPHRTLVNERIHHHFSKYVPIPNYRTILRRLATNVFSVQGFQNALNIFL